MWIECCRNEVFSFDIRCYQMDTIRWILATLSLSAWPSLCSLEKFGKNWNLWANYTEIKRCWWDFINWNLIIECGLESSRESLYLRLPDNKIHWTSVVPSYRACTTIQTIIESWTRTAPMAQSIEDNAFRTSTEIIKMINKMKLIKLLFKPLIWAIIDGRPGHWWLSLINCDLSSNSLSRMIDTENCSNMKRPCTVTLAIAKAIQSH